MMRTAFLALLIPLFALADGVPVSPDTPNTYVPPPPPRPGKTPPECVNHLLQVVFDGEKEHFAKAKVYSTSFIEMNLAPKLGIGCPGWDVPVVELTYGGSGFIATITESATELKWTINQDKAMIMTEKKIKPLPAALPTEKK